MKNVILIIMYIALVGYGFYVQNQNEGIINAFGEIPTLLFDLVIAYFVVFKLIGGMWSEHDEEKDKNDIKPPQSKPIIREISKDDLYTNLNEYPKIESKEIADEPQPIYVYNPDLVVELVEKRPIPIKGGNILSNYVYDRNKFSVESCRRLYKKEKILIKSAKIERIDYELLCHIYAVENSEDRYYGISRDNIPTLKDGDILDINSIQIIKLKKESTGELVKKIDGIPIGYNE